MIRQHDEVLGRETFDLRPPAGADAAETGDQHQRRLAAVSEGFVMQRNALRLELWHDVPLYLRRRRIEALARLAIAGRFLRAHKPSSLTGSSSERPSRVSS